MYGIIDLPCGRDRRESNARNICYYIRSLDPVAETTGNTLAIHLIDQTELHIKEYVDDKDRTYSYHWQSNSGKLIIRWDNSPHHKLLPLYPHHKHTEQGVLPSFEIRLEDILRVLEERIKR